MTKTHKFPSLVGVERSEDVLHKGGGVAEGEVDAVDLLELVQGQRAVGTVLHEPIVQVLHHQMCVYMSDKGGCKWIF